MSTVTALTDKQAKFVLEFLVDSNGTQAAIRAGYSVSGARVTAHRLLTNDAIYGAVETQRRADAARLSLRREDVLAGLLDAAAMAKLQSDPAGMVVAWKQVGLLMGYYSPERIKVNLSVEGQPQLNHFERLSDAELLTLIASGGGGGASAY